MAVSSQFIGWVIALGDGVKIVEPESVVEQMREKIRRLGEQYIKYIRSIVSEIQEMTSAL